MQTLISKKVQIWSCLKKNNNCWMLITYKYKVINSYKTVMDLSGGDNQNLNVVGLLPLW